MLKDYFLKTIKEAIINACSENKLGQMTLEDEFNLQMETPKNPEFGDFAVNVSSLARCAKLAPLQIAEKIAEFIDNDGFEINIVAGFINFKVGSDLLSKVVVDILDKKENYAKNNSGQGEKVMLEYVSANPTGPFHIGHGRWAAMGSSLANIMNYSGYDVYQEFYINDAGNQINNLGASLKIRVLQEIGEKVDFPEDEEVVKSYYTGDYLVTVAKEFVKDYPDKVKSDDVKVFSNYAKAKMLEYQKSLLENFNTHFDNFFSETALHESGDVEACIKKIDEAGMLYEKEGATWFKSSKYGDEQDRVIIKSDGSYTYLTADIAYHYDKLKRGFSKLINIWGADHHGYVARMRAAIEALGYCPDSLEILLGQLVNLVIQGEQVRMGKRSKMITLDDLINDVGVDATRFWMIMRSIDTTLDFDIELAKSNTDENPVFYVQYAHARACSIIRNAVNERIDTENKKSLPAIMGKSELENEFCTLNAETLSVLWSENDKKSIEITRRLILKLEEYKNVIVLAAYNRTPYLVTKYVQELAAIFHQFYNLTKVLVDDKELMIARLAVVNSVAIILKSALNLIAVSAPEKM